MASDETFCYIAFRMRKFARVAKFPRWSVALTALIIGSLCFSVGEGLRLTPFPVSTFSQVRETNGLAPTNETGDSSVAKYGPLGVPSQVQKRSKRQTTDFAVEPLLADRQFVTVTAHYSADDSSQLRSALFVSRPTGRAPPLVS